MKSLRNSAVLIVALLSVGSRALSQGTTGADIMEVCTSIRAYGMGIAGVADDTEPANIYFNPANIHSLNGIFLTGGYSMLLPDYAEDMYTFNVGFAGGYQLPLNDEVEIGLAGGVLFDKLDYGDWESTPIYGPSATEQTWERYLSYTLAGGLTFLDIFHLGLGLSAKRYKIHLTSEAKGKALAYDLGLLFNANLLEEKGFTLTPSLGVGYLNLGDDIEFDGGGTAQLPKMLRYGAGLRFESSGYEGIDDILGCSLPFVTVACNFDITKDKVSNRSKIYNYGGEIGFLQMLFLRLGYIHDEDGNIKDYTLGIGTGIKCWMLKARFDYANVPQASGLDRVNKYGFTLGVLF